jgi:hypothetical protein
MGTKSPLTKSKIKGEPKPKREKKPKPVKVHKLLIGTSTPTHAKWPSMFKRHIGVIESHIRTLDRVMQSMRANMEKMEPEERARWESGEEGKWLVICGMMVRARMALADAREAGRGIVSLSSFRGWVGRQRGAEG